MPETFRHRGKEKKQKKKNISNVLEMSEMDNAKGIFEKSSADQNDQHDFKIFQSYALKYKKDCFPKGSDGILSKKAYFYELS